MAASPATVSFCSAFSDNETSGFCVSKGDEPGASLDIPSGRYVPVFVEREQPPCPGDDVSDVEEDVVTAAE
ncbi:hypothetical protein AB9F41_35955, partial [Rhizobium leguminosarum]|uniref:hypothetical protein n=1 Tax=Rhizobium leguminosarum TaxID=384 RepID=UPI003F9B3994